MRIGAVLPFVKGKLLDVGCGMNRLVKAHGNGVGVDVHDWGKVDYVVENSAKLPFDDATFDTVTIIAALNHIANREEVLRECKRLLKPGGRLIITMITPRVSEIWHLLRSPWDADQRERGMAEGEVYGFTTKRLTALVSAQGFSLLVQKRFMLGLNSIYVFQNS
jgi:2-polyprenyl-3-methyl-5-hydroxy-6-metoxy-1,4-benzoquinol methylase